MAQRYSYPARLYDALPYLYVGIGLLTIFVLPNWMATFSGLTLISAGAYVWLLRRRYRSAFKSCAGMIQPRQRSDKVGIDDQTAGLIQMSWRSSFDCGHPVIDAQHRRLFGISNELIDAVLSNRARSDTEQLLQELIHHTREHFATEEGILARANHPLSAEHRDHHAALLGKAERLYRQFHQGEVGAGELIAFLTFDVITNHILKEDLKFAANIA